MLVFKIISGAPLNLSPTLPNETPSSFSNPICPSKIGAGPVTGPAPIFEGQMGFEKELGVSLGNVGDKFKGAPEMILKTSIKFWPAEYHSQSAIEAALSLRKDVGDPAKVKSM